ncbi:MAG: chitinase [Candidatus Binataceae bacterium]
MLKIAARGIRTFTGRVTARVGLVALFFTMSTAAGAAPIVVNAPSHASFFNGEVSDGNQLYHLTFPDGTFFGYYSDQQYPWIYHFGTGSAGLGFEDVFDAGDGGVYFYDPELNAFLYTNPNDYPFFYDFGTNSWLWYASGTSRWFYDFGGRGWFFSPTATGAAFPSHFFAPYVDMTLWPTFNLTNNLSSVGKYYTLAFIVDQTGNGCTASWGTYYVLSDNFPDADIAGVRAAGGDVIVSFGGEANTELAQSCSSVSALEAQYDAVVTQYNLKRVDFDVEGAAVADSASISRRNQALALLQAAHPGLQVSYTLPVLPTGLTSDGVNVIADAIAKGVTVTAVNVMAMDYGWTDTQMGQDAINAGVATASQLGTLYPAKSAAQLDAMIGVTPMIGYNDVAGEVFQLSDAQLLLNYAQNYGFNLIALWSIARDIQCPSQESQPQNTCSGLTQTPFEFSGIFKQLNP